MTDQTRFQKIDDLVQAILRCQGWQEALQSNDPGNVTEWIGPRLGQIQDLARNLNEVGRVLALNERLSA